MINNSDIENIFDYKDYDGENQFTVNLKSGDIFIYKTYDIVSNKEYIFKMVKTYKKHKSCNQCSLIKYYCGVIECCCYIKKVLNYG